MQHIWDLITYHYFGLAENYHVDPITFMCIHLIGTPVFILSISWLIRNYRQKKSMILHAIVSLVIYNVGNVYLIICGKNIDWYIYTIIGAISMISSFFTYKKIRVDMRNAVINEDFMDVNN